MGIGTVIIVSGRMTFKLLRNVSKNWRAHVAKVFLCAESETKRQLDKSPNAVVMRNAVDVVENPELVKVRTDFPFAWIYLTIIIIIITITRIIHLHISGFHNPHPSFECIHICVPRSLCFSLPSPLPCKMHFAFFAFLWRTPRMRTCVCSLLVLDFINGHKFGWKIWNYSVWWDFHTSTAYSVGSGELFVHVAILSLYDPLWALCRVTFAHRAAPFADACFQCGIFGVPCVCSSGPWIDFIRIFWKFQSFVVQHQRHPVHLLRDEFLAKTENTNSFECVSRWMRTAAFRHIQPALAMVAVNFGNSNSLARIFHFPRQKRILYFRSVDVRCMMSALAIEHP